MSGQRSRVCPHLGLVHDTATHMGFPSSDNCCFNAKPINSPNLDHQQSFCLRAAYDSCTLYRESKTRPMPTEIRTARSIFGMSAKIIVAVIALLIIAATVWMISSNWKNLFSGSGLAAEPLPISAQASSPAVTVLPTFQAIASEIAPAAIATLTPIQIVTDTFTPQPSNAGTALPPHGYEVLKMPSGSKQGYLVHIVAVGENLDKIAEHYDTTVQAILAVNYKLKPPVWAQYPLVIPVGAQDETGLPAFKVHIVEVDETTSAEALAEALGVDASALELYNLCSENCQFNTGDVLLVPYVE